MRYESLALRATFIKASNDELWFNISDVRTVPLLYRAGTVNAQPTLLLYSEIIKFTFHMNIFNSGIIHVFFSIGFIVSFIALRFIS